MVLPKCAVVKNPLASVGDEETWVQSLDQEDPWEKEMGTHFSIIAWKIPWAEKPGGLSSQMWLSLHTLSQMAFGT